MPIICYNSAWLCVTSSCLVNQLVTWLSYARNIGWLKHKVTMDPISTWFKDDHGSSKKIKGRFKVFKTQGMDLESRKTGPLDWWLTTDIFASLLPNTLPGPILGGEGKHSTSLSLQELFFLKQQVSILQISVERTISRESVGQK